MKKDYCPGWLDLSFGGVVNADEMNDVDGAALREAEEEMGISNLSKLKLPNGSKSLKPQFAFKHKFEDQGQKAWVYAYFIPWHTSLANHGVTIQPQETEIDLVLWLDEK